MRIPPIVAALALVVLTAAGALAQTPATGSAVGNGSLSPAEVDRIVRAFTTKEAEFHKALNSYSLKRDALIQSIGMGGQVVGEYHRVSIYTFDDQGNRYEKISFFPMSTMPEITQEDIDDLGGIDPFALEPEKIDKYNFRYVGKEKIDELDLYVFDVTPKIMPNPKKTKERLFSATSESLNWVALGGVFEKEPHNFELLDYVPVYRTPANTGGGWAFGRWQ